MYFHQAIAQAVRDHDVEVMFGLVGDANLFLTDSFVRAGGRYVSVTHESAAVLAAAGYSRVADRVGVATVTHGPAVTNIVTALVETVRARTPMVVIAGDTAATDRDGLQNIDQRNIARTAGAGFEQVRSLETMAIDTSTAFRRARSELRPILLNVPVDLTWQEMEYEAVPSCAVTGRAAVETDESLDDALGIIATAHRPVVLAGLGARDPEARASILRFARRIGAPVATTLKARDLFAGEPEDLGICGTLSDERTLSVLEQADCVVAFGAALTRWTTADGALLRGKRTVHVDIDPARLNEHSAVAAPVVGDAAATAAAFIRLLDAADVEPTGFSRRLPPATAPHQYPETTRDGSLDLGHVLTRLDACLPTDRIVTLDCGRFFFHAAPLVRCGAGGRYLHTIEFGSIGLGLGTALGAAAAPGGLPSVLICGDGGLMLSGLAELTTAVRSDLRLIVVVLNDFAYGAEHIQLVDRGMDPGISEFAWPELADVATALGVTGHRIGDPAELETALADLPGRGGPVLLNVHLSPHGIASGPH